MSFTSTTTGFVSQSGNSIGGGVREWNYSGTPGEVWGPEDVDASAGGVTLNPTFSSISADGLTATWTSVTTVNNDQGYDGPLYVKFTATIVSGGAGWYSAAALGISGAAQAYAEFNSTAFTVDMAMTASTNGTNYQPFGDVAGGLFENDPEFSGTNTVNDGVNASLFTHTNDAPTGGVTIDGSAVEGQTLTADTSTLADGDGLGPLHYQWVSNGVTDVGSDQATYSLGAADVGATISVTVSYTDQFFTAESVSSGSTAPVATIAPVLTDTGGATAWTEASGTGASTPVAVDSGLTVTDLESPTLASVTASITGGFVSSEDVLAFTNDGSTMGNIAGSYSAGTGVLTLTSSGATATLAQWQVALDSVTYNDNSHNPTGATRTISFMANDGTASSAISTKTVSLTATDTAPTVTTSGGTAAWTEATGFGASTAVTVDSGITVADVDSATLASATASITGGFVSGEDVLAFTNDGATMGNVAASYSSGTGVLTLTSSGATATLAQWQAALDAVTYNDTSHDPNVASRTISFSVNDGSLGSAVSTDTVSLTAVDTPPVVTDSGGAVVWTEASGGGASTAVTVDSGLSVTDVDSATLASATASITGGFVSSQDLLAFTNDGATMGNITASYASGTGVLTLTSSGATATLAQWQAALDAVTYNNSSHNPTGASRTISFTVNDNALPSLASTKTVSLTAVDDAPTVTTTGGTTATVNQVAAAVDTGLTVADVDNTTLASATASITGGFQSGEDVLAFTNNGSTMGNIGASYNAGTGVLTLTSAGATATLAQWQAALDAVTYTDTSVTPNLTNRTISFAVNDGTLGSTIATKTVNGAAPVEISIQATSAEVVDLRWATLYDELANSPISAGHTATQYVTTDNGHFNGDTAAVTFVVSGTGLTYSGNFPITQLTGGTITGLEVEDPSKDLLATLSGMSISATTFQAALNSYTNAGSSDPTALNAIFLASGYNIADADAVGNAQSQGGNVNDIFHSDGGGNTFDGGAGTNTVDYSGLTTSSLKAVIQGGSGSVLEGGGANGSDVLINIQKLVDVGAVRSVSDVFEVDTGVNVTADSSNFNYLIELTPGVNLSYGTNFTGITEFVSNTGTNTVNFASDTHFAYLFGSTGNDTLTLGSGGGYMIGEGGTNVLTGGANATNLFVGGDGGTNTMNGGTGGAANYYFVSGNDQVNGAGAFNAVIELDTGVTAQLGSGKYLDIQEFVSNNSTNAVTVANADSDFTYLYGGTGNDTLATGSGGGYMIGEGGTNVLTGGGSLNVFVADGGAGVDTMNGGSGSNVYLIDANSIVHGGGTFNTVEELQQSASLVLGSSQLGSDVQQVVFNSGTNSADFHTATSAVFLYGGAGNDTLFGGSGSDFLFGGLGTNTFTFGTGWGQDTIMDWTAGTNDQIDVTALATQGVHAVTDLTQTITGGNDIITSSHTGTNSITLMGVGSALTTSSFHFA